jgi:mono/diheme cytochrome c family protein
MLLLLALAAAWVAWLNVRGEDRTRSGAQSQVAAGLQRVQRGAYLARVGNCATCHTDRGGAAYAGGRGIATPFGTIYAGNLTPDPATGLGRWSASDFWRAMHHGRSRDGRLLYPAFPYPDFTHVTREDSDALYAYLQSIPPVHQPNRPHDLRFPYNLQASLAIWRAMFFSPQEFRADASKSPEWNRGAYLARGLGHCQACHAPRNVFGATSADTGPSGGLIPMQGWYAPSLASPEEAGTQDSTLDEAVGLLKTGRTHSGAAMGPMAEVVFGSTQYMNDADLHALATFLKEIPRHEPPEPVLVKLGPGVMELGARLYEANCSACHGKHGEGGAPAYPPLAGQRAATMASPANLVKVILHGGFPAATAGNPRPYGMPPFGQVLDDAQIAAVASYVRGAWGNQSPGIRPLDVQRLRQEEP